MRREPPVWVAIVLVIIVAAVLWVLVNVQYGGQIIRIPLPF